MPSFISRQNIASNLTATRQCFLLCGCGNLRAKTHPLALPANRSHDFELCGFPERIGTLEERIARRGEYDEATVAGFGNGQEAVASEQFDVAAERSLIEVHGISEFAQSDFPERPHVR